MFTNASRIWSKWHKMMLTLTIIFLSLCQMSCGTKSSVKPSPVQPVLVRTEMMKPKVPKQFLQQYKPHPPKEKTVKGLVAYIIELQSLNDQHNQDKKDIEAWEESYVADTEEDG